MSYFYDPELDRKSSRGMIFENEELRLRTININAEVERGQTDIKRLRRENEQLRREIWTLRDECDRLNKRFKAKLLDHDQHGSCNARGSGGGSSGCTRCPSQSNSDDSDSCDTCKCDADDDDGHCSDDCCQVSTIKEKQNAASKSNNVNTSLPKFSEPQHLHNTFDHLSVVSEETLSNSEVQAALQQQHQQQQNQQKQNKQQQQRAHQLGVTGTTSSNGSQATLTSLMGPLTPLTPIELVANQLNDLQADVPPLSYFENILQDHMGSTIGMTPDTACISPSRKIIKHTNGWDYNMRSPFAQRHLLANSSTSSPSSSSTRSPIAKQCYSTKQTTLTTFVPTAMTSPTIVDSNSAKVTTVNTNTNTNNNSNQMRLPTIETVAITTMPTTVPPPPPPTLGSPKHFFAPLKPRLKINTSLANNSATTTAASPAVPTITTTTTVATTSATNNADNSEFQNCDPPDIYVTNALASPYQRPPLPIAQTPQLPQRGSDDSGSTSNVNSSNSPPNVSPRQRHHHYHSQHRHQHHVMHQQHQEHQQQAQYEAKQQQQKQSLQSHGQQQQEHQQLQIMPNISAFQQNEKARNLFAFDAADILNEPSSTFATASARLSASASASVDDIEFDVNVDVDVEDDVYNIDAIDDFNIAAAVLINNDVSIASASAYASFIDTDTDTDSAESTDTTLDIKSFANSYSYSHSASHPSIFPIEQSMASCFIKSNEPIYAIARERSNSLISAPARTKPLMTATVNSPSKISIATIKLSSHSASNLTYSYGKCANQTESVNLETILNDIEHISEDILAIQLEKNKSNGSSKDTTTAQNGCKSLQQDDKNKKPYRSEMNLQLTYDGANTTIKPANQDVKATVVENSLRARARSLERETTESPSPKIPDAMPEFPDKRTYIGFDHVNKSVKMQIGVSKSNSCSPQKPLPPIPPTRMCPPPLNMRDPGMARSLPTVNDSPTTAPADSGFNDHALTPNKSHLYKTLAHAAAKRAQFRLESPTLSQSFDAEVAQNISVEKNFSVEESPLIMDAVSRKSRRVSIVCGETPTTPEANPTAHDTHANQLSTGSCSNLTATPTNPLLQSLKQATSHSTPNSPHSARRRHENSLAPSSLHESLLRQSHHQHQRSNSSNTGSQQRRPSQDSTRDGGNTATVTPVATRNRCSRRHSEVSVSGNAQRISNSSSHHHHHHHHHQHSASMASNSHTHHNRQSHLESNHETGSNTDRNSNSLSSSRDSSTSLSLRSQRRKISISSHTGGKIPWCGCWGNGCL